MLIQGWPPLVRAGATLLFVALFVARGAGGKSEDHVPVGKTHKEHPSINSDDVSTAGYISRKMGHTFRLLQT